MALPAAHAVGSGGRVDGVDLSGTLLTAAREHAAAQALPNVEFHHTDVLRWCPPDEQPYDVVLCVFGIFFLPDLDAGGAHLLELLRPGGRLAVTTWANGSVEPLMAPFAQATAAEHAAAGHPPAEPTKALAANARVNTPARLTSWLQRVGATEVTVEPVTFDVPLTQLRAWSFVTGSGARAMLFGLDDHAIGRVRQRYLDALDRNGVSVFRAAALIGLGTRCT